MAELFTLEQLEFLDKHNDQRYMQVTTCNEKQEAVNRKFANDDKRIEILIRQQKVNNWLTAAIASGIIALVLKIFIGG